MSVFPSINRLFKNTTLLKLKLHSMFRFLAAQARPRFLPVINIVDSVSIASPYFEHCLNLKLNSVHA